MAAAAGAPAITNCVLYLTVSGYEEGAYKVHACTCTCIHARARAVLLTGDAPDNLLCCFAACCVCACVRADIARVSTLSCTQLAVYNFTEYTSLDQYGGTTSAAWSCSEGCDELRLGNRICDLACNTSACVWDQVSSASQASSAAAAHC